LDSLLDDINTIDNEFVDTKPQGLEPPKTIKFIPHPPSKGRTSPNQQAAHHEQIDHPKRRFVADISSSSRISHDSRSIEDTEKTRTSSIPVSKNQNNEITKNSTSINSPSSSSSKDDDTSLDDLLKLLSQSPTSIKNDVVPMYKPSSSIIFTPPTLSGSDNIFSSYSFNADAKSQSQSLTSSSKETPAASASYISSSSSSTSPPADRASVSIKVGSFQSSSSVGSGSGGSSKAKCSKVMLAGSSSSRGIKASAFSKAVCDNLRCLQCNFTVHWFADSCWDETVDYMFVRNNMPNDAKLSSKLVVRPGSAAYCCQCSWTAALLDRVLGSGPGEPQWVCAGH